MSGGLQMSFGERLVAAFGPERVRQAAPLAPFTTFRVGGPAQWLVEAHAPDEIVRALRMAAEASVPVTMLGGGSNVLVGDGGVDGLVIRVHGGGVEQPAADLVRVDAGVTINGLVRWMIGRGLSGLEAWAGTPGTVGGGVHGNAHFRGRLLSELIVEASVADRFGRIQTLPAEAMDFGYDRSRLQQTGEALLSATFRVGQADPDALRAVARESLAFRKRTQPLHQPSAGCIFQNPDPAATPLPPGVPASAGALVDVAGLKGASEGPARVSTTHGNFIVNEGGATARQIRALIERCRAGVERAFHIRLREEIVYLGRFD
jgi:UDP-N-acetylmuramate dehydrogenase